MTTEYCTETENTTTANGWTRIASGIWSHTFGDMDRQQRYTDLAAEPPRLEALNALPDANFPFRADGLTHLLNDGRISVRIEMDQDEQIYGFGLQLDGLKMNKKVLTLNVDHWGRGGGRSHAPVPFYVSSKGYGVFFNTARFLKVYCQLGNRKDSPNNPLPVDRNPPEGPDPDAPWEALPAGEAVEAHVSGPGLEVIVFSGATLLDVVRRYNLFCGGGAMPPLWGLGFWHRVNAAFGDEETAAEVAQFKERKVPLDVIGLEPGWMTYSYPCTFEWQAQRFPDPGAFSQQMLDEGIHLNLWVNPYVSPKSRIYNELYPYCGSHMVWLGIVPDYTMPEARQLMMKQHMDDHFSIGISGYKVDEVDGYDFWLWPDHATFPSGTSAESMRQSYGLLMQDLLYKDLFKANNQRTYGNVRSSNGAGSAYPFVIYSDSYDHAEYITGISTASLCGILWTPETRTAGCAREWLNRLQTVCFSPMAKLNAWASSTQPWSFPEVEDAVRRVIQLRMRLLPYLYSAFADYHLAGTPPMRAMILEGGADAVSERVLQGELDGELDPYAMDKIIETTDQFMFGPHILVAPFYGEQDTERSVKLPAGQWYDFYSGDPVGGDTTITVTAASLDDQIPLFVRDGGVVPMLKADLLNTRDAYGADLEIRHYGTAGGSFDLYEDDAQTFAYLDGTYRHRTLSVGKDGLKESVHGNGAEALYGSVELRRMSL